MKVSPPGKRAEPIESQPDYATQKEWMAGAHAMWKGGASEERIEKWVRWAAGKRILWPEIVAAFNAANLTSSRKVGGRGAVKLGKAFCSRCGMKAFQYRATVEVRYGKVERDPKSVVCFLCAEGEGQP